MAEIDPIKLKLFLDDREFRTSLLGTARFVDENFGRQELSVRQLEAQFKSSAQRISGTVKGLAGTIAASFTGRELIGLVDGFTRVQNSLQVAGLEGESLAQVQQQLLELSSRYGVSLESLASLFGNATQAGKELGASQGEIVGLTEAASQALLITGTSATAASGSILGLQQALASGTVRAEEFNQIAEGGLRPLLQAAANAERFGGSVAKLRNAVVDGKVSSDEFFRAILAGSETLGGQASKATLTLAGAFESLCSQLTVYVGEAGKSAGVSAALAAGIQKLADNLDLAGKAIAVIATVMLGRFAAGGIAAAAGLVRTQLAATATAASFNAMTLQATRASTALTVAGGVATGAGRALLGAFGGPVGLAVTALTAGIIYFGTQVKQTEDAAIDLAKANRQASDAEQQHQKILAGLTTTMGEGAKAARDAAKAAREKAQADLAQAQAALKAAMAEREKAAAQAKSAVQAASRSSRGAGGGVDPAMVAIVTGDSRIARANAQIVEAKADIATLERRIGELKVGLNPTAPPAATTEAPKGTKSKNASGPSAAETESRYQRELAQEMQNTLAARRELTTSAVDGAALERQMLSIAVARYKADVAADERFSAAQKSALSAQIDQTAALELQRINLSEREALAQQQLDVMRGEIGNDRDIVAAQARLAGTRDERERLEMRLLDLVYEQERAELEAVVASETATKAQKDIARARLAILGQLRGLEAEEIGRRNEPPLARRRREVADTATNLGDAIENIQLDALDRFTDGLANASTEFIKLGGIAGDVINGIISDMVRLAAQQAIFGSSGGGGILGSLGGLFGGSGSSINSFSAALGASNSAALGSGIKIPGFAGGTRFAPGGLAIVGEDGPELVNLPRGSQVIPNDALTAARSMTGVSAASASGAMNGTIRVAILMDNDVFTARVQEASVPVAVEVVRQNSPGLIQAAKAETMRDMGRPRL